MLSLLALSLVNSAFATDARMYPGASCKAQYSTSSTSLSYSQQYNTSTSALTIDCPVMVDTSKAVSDSYLYVIDNNSSASVTCSLIHFLVTSSSYYWTGNFSTSSSGASASPQLLTTGALSATTSPAYDYFSCSLPASGAGNSAIASYYVLGA